MLMMRVRVGANSRIYEQTRRASHARSFDPLSFNLSFTPCLESLRSVRLWMRVRACACACGCASPCSLLACINGIDDVYVFR